MLESQFLLSHWEEASGGWGPDLLSLFSKEPCAIDVEAFGHLKSVILDPERSEWEASWE